jgi:tetratricopeptide (TPR) repeat protein
MKEVSFIGRENELQELRDLLLKGAKGQGGTLLVEGHAGMGKTTLLETIQKQARQDPELEDTRFLRGECYPHSGPQDAYHPFASILKSLSKPAKKQKFYKAALSILEEAGPDWLQVIPGLGPAVAAGVKTTIVARKHIFHTNDDKHADLPKILSTQYVDVITKIASTQAPLALIIENAHWIDDSSTGLLMRLAREAPQHRLVVIVSYRPSYIDEQHPLHSLKREMTIEQIGQVTTLSGWNQDEIQSYLYERFGGPLHSNLTAWLDHLTKGSPMFVSQYLSLLEQTEVIQRKGDDFVLDGEISYSSDEWKLSGKLNKEIDPPDSIEEVLKQRIERLVEEDRRMLELGSVQGPHFSSSILVEQLRQNEDRILRRLRDIAGILRRLDDIEEHHRLISFYTSEERLDMEESEVYIFEHILMQLQFYTRLKRHRKRYHYQVAEVLERLCNEQSDAPRKLVLGVAHHYGLAEIPLLAAHYRYLAAQSSFSNGAFAETIELCQQALQQVQVRHVWSKHIRGSVKSVADHHELSVNVLHHGLHAKVILLLLMASEARWHGKPGQRDRLDLTKLVKDAEEAASHTDNKALLAQVKFLKGKVLVATHNLGEAIAVMKEALEIARNANDPLLQFAIMPNLGMQMNGENLVEGLRLQYEAYDLYKTELASRDDLPTLHKIDLQRHFYHLHGYIGVGEFDRGNFDQAVNWLESGISGLRHLKMHYDLHERINYLGQVYIAMGLFEKAEVLLSESIESLENEEEANPWKGYNLALLGKLYLEWLHTEKAVEPLRKGWQETEASWFVAIVPLVRNYYAELLMHPSYKDRDLTEADHLLGTTIEECKVSGFHRSAISALSSRGQLALMQKNIGAAVTFSTEAVEFLTRLGEYLAAVRTEEIWFNQYRVLKAAGQDEEARIYLDKAHAVLQKKADSISDKERRRAFMERVPVSRDILAELATVRSA